MIDAQSDLKYKVAPVRMQQRESALGVPAAKFEYRNIIPVIKRVEDGLTDFAKKPLDTVLRQNVCHDASGSVSLSRDDTRNNACSMRRSLIRMVLVAF